MASGTKEIHLEEHIEKHLCEHGGYRAIANTEYDLANCLVPSEFVAFVKETQPKKYAKLQAEHGANTDKRIAYYLSRKLSKEKNGTLNVLRNTLNFDGLHFDTVYFQPANRSTPEHAKLYAGNRLAIMRQVKYSDKHNKSLDMALFVNGIPVATLELKNALTGQTHAHAIKQYMTDRDPKEPLFHFKRCLVHFAVGTEKVSMCTRLEEKKTFFLPFNQGLVNENPNGFATSYLWEDVLTKDSLLNLIQNYAGVQVDTEMVYNQVTRQLEEKKSTKLIFPRYHQRKAVEHLLAAVREDGVGNNYLVYHSAGSGKSNTITWLAHRLSGFYQKASDTRPVFNTILVVTDRKVLNNQINKYLEQFSDIPGVFVSIDDSKTSQDLKNEIEKGTQIIGTTIQKFPIISETIAQFSDRTFAVLIDEAHSSQSGETARHLRKALSLKEAEDLDENKEVTLEDIIQEEIQRKGKQPNLSFFAFTATPKEKTIELFGTLKDGRKEAFDKYTMEQAIEEGFILDVVKGYMSFKRYYKLIKRADKDDKEYEKKKTVRLLSNYVDLTDHAIEKKSRVMIEHFVAHTQKEIQGRARAMLVTRSRLHAVRYKRKFDEVMREMKLPYGALVAFSGTVKDAETGEDYTESSMNQLGGKVGIAEALKLPQNRILIVANKFQTGYDEPLLHTMFVDKKLGGTSTVQTLSRLNRKTKGKDSTMVLDFVNDPQGVLEDFQKFYGSVYMMEDDSTDPNSLYEVLSDIQGHGIIHQNDLEAYAQIFFRKGDHKEQLQPILNQIVERFKGLEEESQDAFKAGTKSYVRLYRFLTQLMEFADIALEKNYVLLADLLQKLPGKKNTMPTEVLNDIDLDSYKVQYQFEANLNLVSEDHQVYGMTPGGAGGGSADELELLTRIIKTLNETFGLELSEEDKVDFMRMRENLYSDQELMGYFNKSNTKENIQDKFFESIDDELLKFINTKLELYNTLSEDRINSMFKRVWFNELYDQRVRGISKR